MSLEEIVEGCKKKDRKSQQALYVLFAPKMRAACYLYIGSSQETKDILHDGFIKVFNQISQFQGAGSVEGWIRRVIVNTCLDHLRKRKRVEFSSIDETGNDYPNCEEENQSTSWEQYATLSKEDIVVAINDLKEEYRIIFNMACIDNFSHKEIAEKLGIKETTSRSKLRRAREILRSKLEILVKEKSGYIQ